MRRRYELLGREGGMEYIILIFWRKPFAVYFTVKTPWVFDRGLRFRFGFGADYRWRPYLQFVTFSRDRCKTCRELTNPWFDGPHSCADRRTILGGTA